MISAIKCCKVFSRKNTAKCQRCFQNAVIVNKTVTRCKNYVRDQIYKVFNKDTANVIRF